MQLLTAGGQICLELMHGRAGPYDWACAIVYRTDNNGAARANLTVPYIYIYIYYSV